MREQINNLGIHDTHSDFVEFGAYRKLIHDLRNALSSMLMQSQLLSQYAKKVGSGTTPIEKSAAAIEHGLREMALLLANK